jgi:formylglycine-generating enzyme required for sulfatase activity
MYLIVRGSAGGAGMADIFISYSKKHAALTEALARDLEAEGYSTWWDANLLPDDGFFPETIRAQIAAAKAVIVIWAEHSVTSRWVYSEASEADAYGKLLQLRDEALDPRKVPMPFTAGNIAALADRAKVFAALARRSVAPSNNLRSISPKGDSDGKKTELAAAPPAQRPAPQSPPTNSGTLLPGLREFLSTLGEAVAPPPRVPPVAPAVRFTGADGRELKPGDSFKDAEFAPEMVIIPAGSFMMGSKEGEGSYYTEYPQHEVTIPRAFAVGKYPVTFDEWDAAVEAGGVRKTSDQGWGRGRRPVINIIWSDVRECVEWLAARTGRPYRLLSEAEWEYACRAGSPAVYCFGDGEGELGRYAWYEANSGGQTHPVGEKAPNAFGLYDMHGNVWEWCEDYWYDSYQDKPESLNASGGAWTTRYNELHTLRGGSWDNLRRDLRAAARDPYPFRNDVKGFRVGLG